MTIPNDYIARLKDLASRIQNAQVKETRDATIAYLLGYIEALTEQK